MGEKGNADSGDRAIKKPTVDDIVKRALSEKPDSVFHALYRAYGEEDVGQFHAVYCTRFSYLLDLDTSSLTVFAGEEDIGRAIGKAGANIARLRKNLPFLQVDVKPFEGNENDVVTEGIIVISQRTRYYPRPISGNYYRLKWTKVSV